MSGERRQIMTIAREVQSEWKSRRICSSSLAAWLLPILVVSPFANSAWAADRLVFRVSSTQSAGQPAGEVGRNRGAVLRDIFDPCLGFHWQLRVNPLDPDGPRRMVLLNPGNAHPHQETGVVPRAVLRPASLPGASFSAPSMRAEAHNSEGEESAPLPPVMVIRTGDRITLEQDSEFVHARFEAVALEPAVAGQRLRVRLSSFIAPDLSAPVISVLALGAGSARWINSAGGGR